MSDSVKELAWDTEFLGIGVCRIEPGCASNIVTAVNEARQQGMRLAYLFVDPANMAVADAASALGARLVDRKVTYLRDVPKLAPQVIDPHLKSATEITPTLRSLAIQRGHHSRFKADPGFAPGTFEQMYGIWLERSVSGAIAKEVLVFEDNGQERGFITLGIKNGRTNIGLIAVDHSSRGSGIGARLLDAAFSRAMQWGSAQIEVVTQQDNAGACRFYERCGFIPEKVEHIYHIWID